MALSTKPYKGTRDFYPEDQRVQHWIFEKMRAVANRYGYLEYNGPMLESFDLYAAKTGEEIVKNQLYWFEDRGERKLAVRPEMTPTLARMVAAKVMELPKPIRWFSLPNLWRYERPQRGRLREHWQLNVDVLGGNAVAADSEILRFAASLMEEFGGLEHVEIRVNHRQLMDEFFTKRLGLSPEVAQQAVKAIDARDKVGEESYRKWLGEVGLSSDQQNQLEAFFKKSLDEVHSEMPCLGTETLKTVFDSVGKVPVVFDSTIMRGLDYYTGTVFEMFDTSPENRRAMFGGGRYDNLIGLFGKHQLSGVGFGMGDVTLRNFLEVHGLLPNWGHWVDLFVTVPKEDLWSKSDEIADQVRRAGASAVTPLSVGKFGDQLKQASKLGARFAAILGDAELAKGQVMLKDLSSGDQREVEISKLAEEVKK